jgi:hypothetical protein
VDVGGQSITIITPITKSLRLTPRVWTGYYYHNPDGQGLRIFRPEAGARFQPRTMSAPEWEAAMDAGELTAADKAPTNADNARAGPPVAYGQSKHRVVNILCVASSDHPWVHSQWEAAMEAGELTAADKAPADNNRAGPVAYGGGKQHTVNPSSQQ